MKCPYCSDYMITTYEIKNDSHYICYECDIGVYARFNKIRFISISIDLKISKIIRTVFDYQDSFFIELRDDDKTTSFNPKKDIYFDNPLNVNSREQVHKLIPKLENILILN